MCLKCVIAKPRKTRRPRPLGSVEPLQKKKTKLLTISFSGHRCFQELCFHTLLKLRGRTWTHSNTGTPTHPQSSTNLLYRYWALFWEEGHSGYMNPSPQMTCVLVLTTTVDWLVSPENCFLNCCKKTVRANSSPSRSLAGSKVTNTKQRSTSWRANSHETN
jgi:hypothetical protein